MEIDMEKIKELIELVKESQISELTIRTGEGRITIKKEFGYPAGASSQPAEAKERGVEALERGARQYVSVKSPWVGLLRLTQDGKPLISVGAHVEKGQVVCVVESLRVKNEVHAPESGTIVQVFVEDGQPVEFGQELMLLECQDQ